MAKKVTYNDVLACPMHQSIYIFVRHLLNTDGYFEISKVIEKTSCGAVQNAIRWDYIVRMVQEGRTVSEEPEAMERELEKLTLIPLAEPFFKTKPKHRSLELLQRFIAQGYGKRTAGYGVLGILEGRIAVKIRDNKEAQIVGQSQALAKLNEDLETQGLIALDSPEHRLEITHTTELH
jgi:hypothetical protein